MEGTQAKELTAWLVESAAGSRRWQAEDIDHALEQHRNAFPDEAVLAAGLASVLGRLTGADFTEGAYDGEEECGCGEPITWFEGGWMHIISEDLRGTGDHTAEPAGGYYVPDGMGEEDDEEPAEYLGQDDQGGEHFLVRGGRSEPQ